MQEKLTRAEGQKLTPKEESAPTPFPVEEPGAQARQEPLHAGPHFHHYLPFV